MSTKSLLVELFVEELPPKSLKKLGDAFGGVLVDSLRAQGLLGADAVATTFASPRRLAVHTTIANNSGSSAIYSVNGGAVVNLGNTILSNNPAGNCTAGAANLISSGNNIIDTSPACTGDGFAPLASDKVGVDPKLGPLFPLGFHVLYTDSPSINQAGAGTCPFTDQVGNTRPQDSACDIGAYEYSSGGTTPTNILHTLANPQITLTPELSTTTFSARILDANGAACARCYRDIYGSLHQR